MKKTSWQLSIISDTRRFYWIIDVRVTNACQYLIKVSTSVSPSNSTCSMSMIWNIWLAMPTTSSLLMKTWVFNTIAIATVGFLKKERGRSVTFHDNQSARKTSRICCNTIERITMCYTQHSSKRRFRINSQKPHNTSPCWTNYGVSVLSIL